MELFKFRSQVDGSAIAMAGQVRDEAKGEGHVPTARVEADAAKAVHLAAKAKLRAAELDLAEVPGGALILAEARVELLRMDEEQAYRNWKHLEVRAQAVEAWLDGFKQKVREG